MNVGGHSDVVGGAVLTNDEEIFKTVKFHQNAVGGVPSPFDAWLTLRGVKTLAIRMRQHEENARQVADWLTRHEAKDEAPRMRLGVGLYLIASPPDPEDRA